MILVRRALASNMSRRHSKPLKRSSKKIYKIIRKSLFLLRWLAVATHCSKTGEKSWKIMEKQTSIQMPLSSWASNGTSTQLSDLRIDFEPLPGAYPFICCRSISFRKRLQGLVNAVLGSRKPTASQQNQCEAKESLE